MTNEMIGFIIALGIFSLGFLSGLAWCYSRMKRRIDMLHRQIDERREVMRSTRIGW